MPTSLEALTADTCFKVVDLETCARPDGLLRMVSIAIVEVTNGQLNHVTQQWLINPGTPIDAASRAVHHIKDADVAASPTFADACDDILTALTSRPTEATQVIWVAHNAQFDVTVLHSECGQVQTPLPDVPVLDTMALPEHVGDQFNTRLALPELAARYGVTGLQHHDAASDAETTARILLALLNRAADSDRDLDGLLLHGKRSTDYAAGGQHRPTSTTTPAPSAAETTHIAQHPLPLPVTHTKLQRKQWALAFLRCSETGCAHTDPLVRQLHQPDLFEEVSKQALSHLTPGSPAVANYLGFVQDPTLLAHTYNRAQVLTWWRTIVTKLDPTRCSRDESATRCRRCQEGLPCPADVFYQSVARVACGASRRGTVSVAVIQKHAQDKRQLAAWRDRGLGNVAGYVAWLGITEANEIGDVAAAGKLRAHSETLNLTAYEPRLALTAASRALTQERRGVALNLVEDCLATESTDPIMNQVRDFYYTHLLSAPEPPTRAIKTSPRYSATARRPQERRTSPRFKID